MVTLWLLLSLLVVQLACGQEACPTLPGQLGHPQDLDLTNFSVFLDPEPFPGKLAPLCLKACPGRKYLPPSLSPPGLQTQLYFIEDGAVAAEFSSLSAMTDEIVWEANQTSLPLHFSLESTPSSSQVLHYSLAIYPLEMAPAVEVCTPPQPGLIQSGTTQSECWLASSVACQ